MNKNVKKTLLFVAILIAVIVIISAIYLLLPAPGEDGGKTPEPSGSRFWRRFHRRRRNRPPHRHRRRRRAKGIPARKRRMEQFFT